jgi:hypothetical protein
MASPDGSVPVSSEPSPSAPSGAVGPTETTARAPLARRLWPVLVVVVVVAIVVAYFAVAGSGSGNSGGGGTGTLFSSSSAAADRSAVNITGGPWVLVTALGYAPSNTTSVGASSTIGSGCSVAPAGSSGIPTSVVIPKLAGSFSGGAASWWGMFYYQSSTQKVLVVEVVGGVATPLLIASGTCVSEFGNLTAIPTNVVDSSVAASAAWTGEGSTFVSVHSGLALNLEMAIVGGGSYEGTSLGPTWFVEYSPCLPLGLGGPTGNQPQFEAIVDATSGSVSTFQDTTTTC